MLMAIYESMRVYDDPWSTKLATTLTLKVIFWIYLHSFKLTPEDFLATILTIPSRMDNKMWTSAAATIAQSILMGNIVYSSTIW